MRNYPSPLPLPPVLPWLADQNQVSERNARVASIGLDEASKILTARFTDKIVVTDDGCWAWTASTGSAGYGQWWNGNTMTRAHRYAYEALVGPIPADLECDHLCRVRRCVNPAHLELVTHAENMRRRGVNGVRRGSRVAGHLCGNGHEWTPEITIVNARGARECRACRKEARQRRKREAEIRSGWWVSI